MTGKKIINEDLNDIKREHVREFDSFMLEECAGWAWIEDVSLNNARPTASSGITFLTT